MTSYLRWRWRLLVGWCGRKLDGWRGIEERCERCRRVLVVNGEPVEPYRTDADGVRICDPCERARFADDFGVDPHPSRKFKAPGWDTPGRCVCGAPLPPMSKWANAGSDWSNVLCSKCGTGFVDEEDFIAIYDPENIDDPDEWKVRT